MAHTVGVAAQSAQRELSGRHRILCNSAWAFLSFFRTSSSE